MTEICDNCERPVATDEERSDLYGRLEATELEARKYRNHVRAAEKANRRMAADLEKLEMEVRRLAGVLATEEAASARLREEVERWKAQTWHGVDKSCDGTAEIARLTAVLEERTKERDRAARLAMDNAAAVARERASLANAYAYVARFSPFTRRCADALAAEVDKLVRSKVLDSRSPAADAFLDYKGCFHDDDVSKTFVVLSVKYTLGKNFLSWWGPNRCAYYLCLESAGRYTEEEAREIERNCGADVARAIPLIVAERMARRFVYATDEAAALVRGEPW